MSKDEARPMRSDMIKKGFERAPHRSLLYATGVVKSEDDFKKPFIGVCNSFVEVVPGHVHLQEFGKLVKDAIRAAGGIPFEFNSIAICDGVAMGHGGMKFSLASREIIADAVESMVAAHCFDGLVCIPNCDKIVPGMLMGAVRANVPTIFVSGGPMAAGQDAEGKPIDLIDVFKGVGAYKTGDIDDARLKDLEQHACPNCGSCSGMFTANSMNCLCEALGMALPGNGTTLATTPERRELVKQAARQVMALVERDLKPRDIITPNAVDNAFALDVAMGGSTNTVLHTLALCNEAGIEYPLSRINEVVDRTPHLSRISPASHWHIEDVDRAGGISAILKELTRKDGLLHLDAITVTGKTLGENIAEAQIKDPEVIRPLEKAHSQTGGLAILFGNLAPEGAVVKTAAVDPRMMEHEGPARIFDSQDDACAGILDGKVEHGDVVVIRYEGPKGGPGMQEMLAPTSYILGMGMGHTTALITDGRFSGGTAGPCIGHVSPEAAEGGPIGLLKDGDIIRYSIAERVMEVKLSDEELARRRAAWQPRDPGVQSKVLRRYASLVTSGSTGAVLKDV